MSDDTQPEYAVQLLPPNVERDAPFAYSWFTRPEGRDTLLRMGNAEHEIPAPSLRAEQDRIQEFIELEAANKQITRAISVDGITIGAVWLELTEQHGVKPPSLHIMIGNPDYRGRGVGKQAMLGMVEIAKTHGYTTIYTRHLVQNTIVKRLNDSLGFVEDGDEYTDQNGLVWQPVILSLATYALYGNT